MSTRVDILAVCGAGVVSSSMVSQKLKSRLSAEGYDVHTVETNPGGVGEALASQKFDFIASVTPLDGEYSIPKLNAVGVLTGFGEDEFVQEALKVLQDEGK